MRTSEAGPSVDEASALVAAYRFASVAVKLARSPVYLEQLPCSRWADAYMQGRNVDFRVLAKGRKEALVIVGGATVNQGRLLWGG